MEQKQVRIKIHKETKDKLNELMIFYNKETYTDLISFLLDKYSEKLTKTKPEHIKINEADLK
jgi:hypothetical protein